MSTFILKKFVLIRRIFFNEMKIMHETLNYTLKILDLRISNLYIYYGMHAQNNLYCSWFLLKVDTVHKTLDKKTLFVYFSYLYFYSFVYITYTTNKTSIHLNQSIWSSTKIILYTPAINQEKKRVDYQEEKHFILTSVTWQLKESSHPVRSMRFYI